MFQPLTPPHRSLSAQLPASISAISGRGTTVKTGPITTTPVTSPITTLITWPAAETLTPVVAVVMAA